ncbi:SDR family NAD(P)-dependent oxidoreductase [Saccharopolyspora sp. WRP15-2]|uniref:SDR family NAD(P)-dependent oxidoreductase n=1 Tax=Saccharopolyspora oryzae TaxID=2997343 RepID=A0ABT4VAA0_9PSEU|nr:SDR family NAD(P)-dependent oxidoreductase [Saccharopolyspora oryzae]MDA3630753.1 SDR family NAD(P)-dependent oxidoreductase [Saccharopolyspora oryzae]
MTVVITGGTSGIGAATALRFAESGTDVLAIGLPPAEPDQLPVHERIAVALQDVTDRDALSALIGGVDRVEHLVACAGISGDRREYEPQVWEQVLAVNLTSVFTACTAARDGLAATGGSAVAVSSMFAFTGSADRPAYSASKGGVGQLVRSLAIEYAPLGVRVNCVAPGFVVTPLARGVLDDPVASAAVLARIPMSRLGDPAEVASVIEFLCSPAARYVTGAVVPVDGGYSAA